MRISWSAALKSHIGKNKQIDFAKSDLTQSLYRPFTRQWLYYSRTVNERVYQMPRIFPMGEVATDNQVVMVKQRQHEGSQFALMTTVIPELQSDGGTQCFPEYLYEASERFLQLTECQEKNLLICVSGGGQKVSFTALMTNALPGLHMADIGGSQCFPMFLYDNVEQPA